MTNPTLVVSDPPHDEVDLEAVAELLRLDVFAAGLKAGFTAPEVFGAAGSDGAVQLAVALRKTGLRVTILPGASLVGLPWPDPVTFLAFDDACLRVAATGPPLEISYDTDALGVVCEPPAGFRVERPLDLEQAMASGHPHALVEALKGRGFVDLYFLRAQELRRVTIVPETFRMQVGDVLRELERRFTALRLDRRLQGVRPRARFVRPDPDDEDATPPPGSRRRGYSFGTERLADVLEAIEPDLATMSQYEIGSRTAYALRPLDTGDVSGA